MAKFKETYSRQEYEDAVRSAFRLGMRERQMRLEQRIAALETGNNYLAAEIARLDQDEHLDGLIVPLRLLDRIRRALDGGYKTQDAEYQYRKSIKKVLEKHMQIVGGSIDELIRKVEDAK